VQEQPWRARFDRALRQAVEQIVRHYEPERVYVFGSVARGDVHEDSGLDLLIIKETNRAFLDRIDDVMRVVDVDVPVEPLVYTPDELHRLREEGRDFIATILEKAKLCYGAGHQRPRGAALVPDRRA